MLLSPGGTTTFKYWSGHGRTNITDSPGPGADIELFDRILVVAQTRALDLRDVLCYEPGPVPWALSPVYGTLANNPKSKLLEIIDADVLPA